MQTIKKKQLFKFKRPHPVGLILIAHGHENRETIRDSSEQVIIVHYVDYIDVAVTFV